MNTLRQIAALEFTTLQPCWSTGLDDSQTYCYKGIRLLSNSTVVGEFTDHGFNTDMAELFSHVFKDTDGKVTIRNDLEIMEAFFQKGKYSLAEMVDCAYSNNLEHFSRVTARLVNARELKHHLVRGKTWPEAVEKLKSSFNDERQIADLTQMQEFLDLVQIVRDKTKIQTSVSPSVSAVTEDEWVEVVKG